MKLKNLLYAMQCRSAWLFLDYLNFNFSDSTVWPGNPIFKKLSVETRVNNKPGRLKHVEKIIQSAIYFILTFNKKKAYICMFE